MKENKGNNSNTNNFNLKDIKNSINKKLYKTNNILVLKQIKKILEINEKNHL